MKQLLRIAVNMSGKRRKRLGVGGSIGAESWESLSWSTQKLT